MVIKREKTRIHALGVLQLLAVSVQQQLVALLLQQLALERVAHRRLRR